MSKYLAVLMTMMLAGCLGRQEAPVASATFDFAPLPVATPQGVLPAVDVVLPAWLNTQTVQYRLLYRDANELHEYAFARWAGIPSALIQQRLRLRLAGVLGSDESCRLQVQLHEYSQNFASAERSDGVIRGEARVFDKQKRLLATRALAVAQPAASADARGGVGALAGAVDQMAIDITVWWRDDKRLAACK